MTDLFGFEDVASGLEEGRDESEVARSALAAEYLVCADILLRGYDAFIVVGQRPYDLLVDVGPRLLRVQVKSTMRQRRQGQKGANRYCFRGGGGGISLHRYRETADALAFVAMDLRAIIYAPTNMITTHEMAFSGSDFRSKRDLSWEQVIRSALLP